MACNKILLYSFSRIKPGYFFPDMHFIFGGKDKFEPPKVCLSFFHDHSATIKFTLWYTIIGQLFPHLIKKIMYIF